MMGSTRDMGPPVRPNLHASPGATNGEHAILAPSSRAMVDFRHPEPEPRIGHPVQPSKSPKRLPWQRGARADGGFRPLVGITLWCLGLLVALMTGMVSAYLLVSGLWIGSRIAARVRGSGAGRPKRIG